MSFADSALAVALTLGSLAAPAAAVCVDPDDTDCQATIQAGVAAAAPGEEVTVAAGLYNEEVTIGTAGVILRGKGVFIDPSGLPLPAHAITVTGANVVIDGIAIRNGDDSGIVVNGVGGVSISGVDIQSPDDQCIDLVGATTGIVIEGSRLRSCADEAVRSANSNGLQLLGNTIEGTGGVDVTGNDILVERNTFTRNSDCINVDGANAVVTGNRLAQCDGGIDVVGDDASLTRNTLTNTEGTAIDVEGDDFVVEGNPITSAAGTGIAVFCDTSCGTARVTRNRLSAIGDTGIDAESNDPNLQIEGNQISQAAGGGLDLVTMGASVVSNRVTGAGGAGDPCLDLEGDDNTLSGNGLATCGADGIRVDGDDNVIDGNRVSVTGDDGIDVESPGAGNQVTENSASGASDNGIEVSPGATSNTVTGNSASGLHADYCDGGTATGGDPADDTTDCGDIDD